MAAAVRAHPEYLGGTRRDVTALIRAVPGLIAKDGAEAVYAAALDDGRAVALKIADGGQRARPVVMAEALRVAGVPASDLEFLRARPGAGPRRSRSAPCRRSRSAEAAQDVRAVVQRVDGARVRVDGAVVGSIEGPGPARARRRHPRRRAGPGRHHRPQGRRAAHPGRRAVGAGRRRRRCWWSASSRCTRDTRKGRRPSWSAAAPGRRSPSRWSPTWSRRCASAGLQRGDRGVRRAHAGRAGRRRPGHPAAGGLRPGPSRARCPSWGGTGPKPVKVRPRPADPAGYARPALRRRSCCPARSRCPVARSRCAGPVGRRRAAAGAASAARRVAAVTAAYTPTAADRADRGRGCRPGPRRTVLGTQYSGTVDRRGEQPGGLVAQGTVAHGCRRPPPSWSRPPTR